MGETIKSFNKLGLKYCIHEIEKECNKPLTYFDETESRKNQNLYLENLKKNITIIITNSICLLLINLEKEVMSNKVHDGLRMLITRAKEMGALDDMSIKNAHLYKYKRNGRYVGRQIFIPSICAMITLNKKEDDMMIYHSKYSEDIGGLKKLMIFIYHHN